MFAPHGSLDQDLHRYALGLADGAQIARAIHESPPDAHDYADDWAQDDLGQLLAACEDLVSARLRKTRVVHAVLGSGVFNEEDASWHDQRPGAPYVFVGVESQQASVSVQRALAEVALNGPTSWMCDWEPAHGVSYALKVAIDLKNVRADFSAGLSRTDE